MFATRNKGERDVGDGGKGATRFSATAGPIRPPLVAG